MSLVEMESCKKKDSGAHCKFWKGPLTGIKILFCGHGFHP